jgi:hypothetical protein
MNRPSGILSSPWLNAVAALIGGLMLGFGLGRFVHHPSFPYGALALVGLLILWYAVSDYRKARPDAPESETRGHTIE